MSEFLSDGISASNEQIWKTIILIAAIVILVSILGSVFRMMMPILVIGLVMVVFLGFSPNDVINKGKQLAFEGTNFFRESILPYLYQAPDSLIERDDQGNQQLEISPEDKFISEEELKKFDQENEDNHDVFSEPKDKDHVNKL